METLVIFEDQVENHVFLLLMGKIPYHVGNPSSVLKNEMGWGGFGKNKSETVPGYFLGWVPGSLPLCPENS